MLACTNLKYLKNSHAPLVAPHLGLGACLRLCLPPFQTTKCKNKTKKQGIEYKHEDSLLKLYYPQKVLFKYSSYLCLNSVRCGYIYISRS